MTSDDASVLEIEHEGQTLVVGGPSVVIGRSKNATIRVIHPLVSREHCRIDLRAEGLFIEDLGSANGTHVNGKPTKGPTRVQRGDKVTLGRDGAEILLKRAEHAGRDLLDPDEGDLATMLVGDPRARDVAARIALGHDAGERRTLEVEAPTPTPLEVPEAATAAASGAIDELEPLSSVVAPPPPPAPPKTVATVEPLPSEFLSAENRPQTLQPLPAERPQTLQPLGSEVLSELPTVEPDLGDEPPPAAAPAAPPRRFGAGMVVGILLGLAAVLAAAVLLDLPARFGAAR